MAGQKLDGGAHAARGAGVARHVHKDGGRVGRRDAARLRARGGGGGVWAVACAGAEAHGKGTHARNARMPLKGLLVAASQEVTARPINPHIHTFRRSTAPLSTLLGAAMICAHTPATCTPPSGSASTNAPPEDAPSAKIGTEVVSFMPLLRAATALPSPEKPAKSKSTRKSL